LPSRKVVPLPVGGLTATDSIEDWAGRYLDAAVRGVRSAEVADKIALHLARFADHFTAAHGHERLTAVVRRELLFSINAHLWSAAIPLLELGTVEQRRRWLPRMCDGSVIAVHAITEPGAGSDAMALTTTASLDGDDYVIDGTKHFITNGPEAHRFIPLAKPRSLPLGRGAQGMASVRTSALNASTASGSRVTTGQSRSRATWTADVSRTRPPITMQPGRPQRPGMASRGMPGSPRPAPETHPGPGTPSPGRADRTACRRATP
jgi:alkylation response protein AidB-like acyl-CoA dehydrogenase